MIAWSDPVNLTIYLACVFVVAPLVGVGIGMWLARRWGI